MVIAASVGAELVAQTFRPSRDRLESTRGLTASFGAALLTALVALLAYAVFVRLTERRRPSELQLRPALREVSTGILIGLGLCTASVSVIWLLGGYQVVGIAARSAWMPPIVNGLTIAAASSVIEELLLRGLVLRILAEALGRWWALGVSSLLFGVLHMANPGASVIVGLGLAIEAGFLLGVSYLWTERLWVPIGLHGAWNFAQAAVFGGALSGYHVSSIIDSKLVGPEWISGGAFGIEGSLVSTILCAATGCAILIVSRRTDKGAGRDHREMEFAQRSLPSACAGQGDAPGEVRPG
jgi:membrane protease YdiL (CAAX protease family)